MHIKPMSEFEGNFGKLHKTDYACRHCKGNNLYYRIWESSCGGYEDYKFECRSCKKTWWVDGIDS